MIKYWISAIFIITVLTELVYISIQQVLRIGANDPQIQIAEDTADRLSHGEPLQTFASTTKIDTSKNLAPFLIIYDNNGRPIESSAILDGQTPVLPEGVFGNAKQSGEDRFTWQPKNGVRIAAVVTRYKDGYVLSGRSIREVETREDDALKFAFVAWITALMVASFPFLLSFKSKKINNPSV